MDSNTAIVLIVIIFGVVKIAEIWATTVGLGKGNSGGPHK